MYGEYRHQSTTVAIWTIAVSPGYPSDLASIHQRLDPVCGVDLDYDLGPCVIDRPLVERRGQAASARVLPLAGGASPELPESKRIAPYRAVEPRSLLIHLRQSHAVEAIPAPRADFKPHRQARRPTARYLRGRTRLGQRGDVRISSIRHTWQHMRSSRGEIGCLPRGPPKYSETRIADDDSTTRGCANPYWQRFRAAYRPRHPPSGAPRPYNGDQPSTPHSNRPHGSGFPLTVTLFIKESTAAGRGPIAVVRYSLPPPPAHCRRRTGYLRLRDISVPHRSLRLPPVLKTGY